MSRTAFVYIFFSRNGYIFWHGRTTFACLLKHDCRLFKNTRS